MDRIMSFSADGIISGHLADAAKRASPAALHSSLLDPIYGETLPRLAAGAALVLRRRHDSSGFATPPRRLRFCDAATTARRSIGRGRSWLATAALRCCQRDATKYFRRYSVSAPSHHSSREYYNTVQREYNPNMA